MGLVGEIRALGYNVRAVEPVKLQDAGLLTDAEQEALDLGHPDAVCVMDWSHCTERWCERYASGCPYFTEDEQEDAR